MIFLSWYFYMIYLILLTHWYRYDHFIIMEYLIYQNPLNNYLSFNHLETFMLLKYHYHLFMEHLSFYLLYLVLF
jgi:hypothetical protein